MAEFFVLRPYRRRAIGKAVFEAVKARHPGLWHIATTRHNKTGESFWAKIIDETVYETIFSSFDGMEWIVRSFKTN